MADGYAQATGNAAFVNLHSAAGLGNGLGTLFTAFRNQSPLIVTAGQQTRDLLPYDPYLGAERPTEFPRPYVKWACEPARAEDVPVAIAQAYAIAMERPRGPVFVSIPCDDWEHSVVPVHARRHAWGVEPLQSSVAELVDALAASKNPALVVGAEVDRQDAYALAIELAERLNTYSCLRGSKQQPLKLSRGSPAVRRISSGDSGAPVRGVAQFRSDPRHWRSRIQLSRAGESRHL
jgi:benzoylformate decarboxylase